MARAAAPPGIPGYPGYPVAMASSVPGIVVMPAGVNGEMGLAVDGADQLAGTDIGPIEPARARLTVTPPRPAPPPAPDAVPMN